MKHKGKAMQSGLKLILWALVALLAVLSVGIVAVMIGHVIATMALLFLGIWGLFALFTLYFFRDPDPQVPGDPRAIVSPGHGTVDVIDETDEAPFMGGRCRRISIFLSVIDVHVQNSPIAGRVAEVKHTPGEFLNAMRTDCAEHNENVMLGLESTEVPGERVGVRLIAGLIARRIIPFVKPGDVVARGERISLIQFGSRAHIYLPMSTKVRVKLGDKVVGGETILAERG